MSLLSVIQHHCRIHALSIPTAVVNSLDTTVTQLYGILNEMLEEIVTESDFNVATKEATFTAVAAASQGLLTDLAPDGFQWIIPGTLWDRSNDLPVRGPLSQEEWQMIQATNLTGANYSYRVRGGELLFSPTPSAPLPEIAFEYASSWIVTDQNGTAKAALTADTDLFLVPEIILKKGLAWRWKNIKGLPYFEDQKAYFSLLNNYIAKDGTRKTINMAGCGDRGTEPRIVVPSSNWNV